MSSGFNILPNIPATLGSAAQALNNMLGLPLAKNLYRTIDPQYYQNTTGGAALFKLVIRSPSNSTYPIYGNNNPLGTQSSGPLTYIFPVTPQAIGRSTVSMATVYDTPGTDKELGVHRLVDQYGQAPPTWTLRGTTGYKFHLTDNYQKTGWQSLDDLKKQLEYFAKANRTQAQSGNSVFYKMELYNYYDNEFWEVVPIGAQSISRSDRTPLWGFYDFTFAGYRKLSAPTAQKTDPIYSTLSQSFNTVLQQGTNYIASLSNAFYPSSIVSSLSAKATGNLSGLIQ